MLILLPPSEGKTAPEGGEPLELGSLAYAAELGGLRGDLLYALERLGRKSLKWAVEALAISSGQAGESRSMRPCAVPPPDPPPRSTAASSMTASIYRACRPRLAAGS